MYGYPSGAYDRTNTMEESGFGATTRWDGYLNTSVAQHWVVGGEIFGSRTRQESSGFDNCPEIPPGTPNLGPRECDFLHTNASDMPYEIGRASCRERVCQSV